MQDNISKMSYETVTELPGTMISKEQLQRQVNRYHFAAKYCQGKDVLELACGAGIGLGLLNACARKLVAGDIDANILNTAKANNDVECRMIDAQNLPFENNSFDVIILFEAIYYLSKPELFVAECRRILRDNGCVIVCNPNKDLPDFNPSPFSHQYYNAPEFKALFESFNFSVECFGDHEVERYSLSSRAVQFAKKTAVSMRLIPSTMNGKRFLKRIVFGKLVKMPHDLASTDLVPSQPKHIPSDRKDVRYKVIFCVARLES